MLLMNVGGQSGVKKGFRKRISSPDAEVLDLIKASKIKGLSTTTMWIATNLRPITNILKRTSLMKDLNR